MASLDRLASMEGWDISDDETDDGPGTTPSDAAAAASRPQCISKGDLDRPTSSTIEPPGNVSLDGRPSTHGNRQPQRNDHRYQQQHQQPNDPAQFSDDGTNDNRTPAAASRKSELSPLARFGMLCRERIDALNEPERRSNERNRASGEPSSQNSSGRALVLAAERLEPSTRAIAWDLPPSTPSQSITQSVDFVRRKGLRGSARNAESGDGDAGVDYAGVDDAAVAKLRKLLRKEQEERGRERHGRDVAEEQARIAYASFEAEAKRALEFENRVRVLNMRITLSSSHNGRAAKDAVEHAEGHPARARSVSPVLRGRAEVRSGASAEVVETRAQMAVIAEATDTAREEAQSALDAVEGFASLNRKLVGELREVICNRGDILEELAMERDIRQHLERKVDDMLGGGLAVALKQKEDIMKARCEKEQVETERVAALHKRMEEEYRLALKSLEQERDRLEEVVSNMDMQLQDELSAQVTRVKEERERATMGFEEICSIRAGFAPRTKRRSKIGRWGARSGTHGGDNSGGGRLEVQRGRIEAQQSATGRVSVASRKKQPLRTIHNDARRPVTGSVGSGVPPQRKTTQHDRKVDPAGSVTSGAGRGARPAIHSSAGRVGSSTVGTGGAGRGDGSAGVAVRAAAAESVEIFLGDFLPKAKQPALVAAAVASGKDADGGGAGGTGLRTKPASKWAAIGRAGKLSARATAVFVEEATKAAEAEANSRLRSIVNGSASLLSASWFSLIKRSTAVSASGYGGDSPGANTSVDATVPTIAVRRMVQTCGLLRGGPGGPTLAHADMELQRNAVGRGHLGYREYFKIMLTLTESRFTGESKNEALNKLSRMLREALGGKGSTPPGPNRQNHAPNAARKTNSGSAAAAAKSAALADIDPTTSLEGTGLDEGLAGAEWVLERDRRALEVIFLHYAGDCPSAANPSSGRGQLLLPFAALLSFCKDFDLTPGLISRENAHLVYVQLAYPHETLLTPKMLASREGTQRRRVAGSGFTGGGDGTGGSSIAAAARAGIGLSLAQWIRWLGLTAVGCTCFDKQRGIYNTSTKKMLGLLQWMEGSVGKSRISSKRGAAVVPAFNLLPPEGAPRARR